VRAAARGLRSATVALGVGALLLAGTGLTGCSRTELPAPAEAAQPALTLGVDLDEPVRIGVLVPTIEGEGAEFRPMVEGVRVATYRFGLGGDQVELAVALDDGTAEGAARAMQRLLDQQVAGVVLAAQGDHVTQALSVADQARTAVVMPYAQPAAAAAGVWSLAPSADAVRAQVAAALTEVGASRPYVAVAPGQTLDLPVGQAGTTGTLDDPDRVAAEVVAALEARQVDAVVVAAGAEEQAALVVALHGLLGSRQLPVVLTPQALTPAFGAALTAAGTTAGRLLTVGTDTGDHLALTASEPGGRAALLFAAMRLAAGDPACRNVYDDDSCAAGVGYADVASHDATVLLLRAVAAAGSAEPAVVREAMDGLRVGAEDGLAGPALDLGSAQALADEDVVVLHASTSDPGMRPATADGSGTSLWWFGGTDG
jgi:ABC-type branched-subunit amino acid transport system substrate-binding protein